MLMRSEPFTEVNRLAQQLFGAPQTGTWSRPTAMPVDSYRNGDEFVIAFDLPGVDTDAIEIDVERNVLTVKAERRPLALGEQAVAQVSERPLGVFARQMFLGRRAGHRADRRDVRQRGPGAADPDCREGQAAQDRRSGPGAAGPEGDHRLTGAGVTGVTSTPAARAGTGLSPEWDRWFDEAFTDLISSDDEWVRAEFDALVGASDGGCPPPPAPPAPPAAPDHPGAEGGAGSAIDEN